MFVGRVEERSAAEAALVETNLVTLVGPGGVGKTRLAEELVRDREHCFLSMANTHTQQGFLEAIADALGVSLSACKDTEAVIDFLGGALQRWEALLVLDNLEQLVEIAAPLLARWLRMRGGPRVLVTSREAMGFAEEVVIELAPLPLPEALKLFRARSTYVDDASDIIDLLEALDRLPLAIELAAARSGVLSARQLAARLERGYPLPASDRTRPTRHQSLHALINWSLELFSPAHRILLARLAIFPGRFTLDAAEQIGAEEDTDVAELIHDLLRHHLLTVRVTDEQRWFGLYESVRSVVQPHDPDPQQTHLRLFDWAERLAGTSGQGQAWGRHETQLIIQTALNHNPINARWINLFEQWLTKAMKVLNADVLLQQLATVLEQPLSDSQRCALLTRRAIICFNQGEHSEATSNIKQAFSFAETLQQQARVRYHQAEFLRRRHDPGALSVSMEAKRLLPDLDNPLDVLICIQIGDIFRQENRLTEARPWLFRAMDAAVSAKRIDLQISIQISLAMMAAPTDLSRAETHLKHANQLLAHSPSQRMIVVQNSIILHTLWGRPQKVRALMQSILPDLEKGIFVESRAYMQSMDAMAAMLTTPPLPDAESCLIKAEGGCRKYRPHSIAMPVLGLALLALRQQQLGLARRRFQALGERFQDSTPLVILARSYLGIIDVLSDQPARLPQPPPNLHPFPAEVLQIAMVAQNARHDPSQMKTLVTLCDQPPSNRYETRVALEAVRTLLSVQPVWRIHRWGNWFEPPQREAVSLGRRRAARLLLIAFTHAHQQAPGQAMSVNELLEAGWPGERIQPQAARKRLHTTIKDLRQLGLSALLQTFHDGYRFDPEVRIDVIHEAAAR